MGPYLFQIFFLKASEILLFNRKLNAQEAFERNLINEIIPLKDFSKIVKLEMQYFTPERFSFNSCKTSSIGCFALV